MLVLIDMFPTAQDVIGNAREPLAKLVDAYADVNTASVSTAGGAALTQTPPP